MFVYDKVSYKTSRRQGKTFLAGTESVIKPAQVDLYRCASDKYDSYAYFYFHD